MTYTIHLILELLDIISDIDIDIIYTYIYTLNHINMVLLYSNYIPLWIIMVSIDIHCIFHCIFH